MQFSVVIPAKNEAASVSTAIASALSQEQTSVEVIVVDDGSTDETRLLVEEICQKDDRVVLLSNATSAGVSAARNQAIKVAKGEWIALLDADDEFLPGRLARLLREAEEHALDMSADNLDLRSEAGEALGTAFPVTELQENKPVSLEVFLSHDIPHKQSMGVGYCKPVIKRDFITTHKLSFREDISCAEDFLFYAECLMAGARLGFSKTSGYLYTVRPDGHGTAFNLQVSRVNRLITGQARETTPSALPVLQIRQRAIDYDAFQKSLRARKYSEALQSMRRLPPSLIMRHAATILANRSGRLATGA